MDYIDYSEIESFIDDKLKHKSKYIICPYGAMGKKIESLLLNKGISQSNIIIVDNGLSSVDKRFRSTKDLIEIYDTDSVIMLCSLNYSKEITKEIKQYINDPFIVDVFKIKRSLFSKITNLYEKCFFSKLVILITFYFYKLLNKLFYKEKNKDIAIILDGGLGDAIVASGLVDNLKKNDYKVMFFCLPHYIDYFETTRTEDNYLKIEYKSDFVKIYDESGSEIQDRRFSFDSVIALIDLPKNKYRILNFASKVRYKKLIGINQKYLWTYDINLKSKISSHITRLLYDIQYLFIKDIPYSSYRYSLAIHQSCKDYASAILEKFNPEKRKTVLINCRTSMSSRCLSLDTVKMIIDELQCKNNYEIFLVNCNFNASELLDENIHYLTFSHFGEICSFISLIDFMITPDTSLVHVGCVFNTRAICIYNNRLYNNKIANNILFGPGPFYENAVQVFTDEYKETEEGDDIGNIRGTLINISILK
ncbi:glycosyltransferase family 9 protein [Succinivibrio dextrinosolvens]|uniref:glycosyltransferase family 9 protein n=1 Tax=Succinivibrio dextrinosolvens TaxID=83771 RepID=UPI0004E1E6CC|nr:hypothetical protein [Succinivibrio dextrinosolvens]